MKKGGKKKRKVRKKKNLDIKGINLRKIEGMMVNEKRKVR
jgi:hypothetical protein